MYEVAKILSKETLKAVIVEGWKAFEKSHHRTEREVDRVYKMRVEIKELIMEYLMDYTVDEDILGACVLLLNKEDILSLKSNPYNLNKLLLTYNAKNKKNV